MACRATEAASGLGSLASMVRARCQRLIGAGDRQRNVDPVSFTVQLGRGGHIARSLATTSETGKSIRMSD